MRLKFYSRDGQTVPLPHSRAVGQPAERIGRVFRAGEPGKPASYPATVEPFECDANSPLAPYLKKQTQKLGLWAGDAETARFCDVEFTPIERDADGEWIAKRALAPAVTIAGANAPKAHPKGDS